jgi:hypothetical protein
MRPAQARIVAHCLLEVVATLLDVWNMAPHAQGPAYLTEVKRIAQALLGEYLRDRSPTTAVTGRRSASRRSKN